MDTCECNDRGHQQVGEDRTPLGNGLHLNALIALLQGELGLTIPMCSACGDANAANFDIEALHRGREYKCFCPALGSRRHTAGGACYMQLKSAFYSSVNPDGLRRLNLMTAYAQDVSDAAKARLNLKVEINFYFPQTLFSLVVSERGGAYSPQKYLRSEYFWRSIH